MDANRTVPIDTNKAGLLQMEINLEDNLINIKGNGTSVVNFLKA